MQYFIITGASKGLGEGIAAELLHPDHHLFCIARTESKALKTLAAAKGASLRFLNFDLAVLHDIPALLDMIFSEIDTEKASGIFLINNAGVLHPVGRAENNPQEEVEHHIRTNLIAPMHLTAGFIRHTTGLAVRKRILNISSGAGRFPYEGWSSYCSGKAGLDMFTRCVALEQQTQPYPAEIMGVAPGIIDTGMQEFIRSTSEEQFIHRDKFIAYKEQGQLVPAMLAGRHLAGILTGEEFKNGEIIDIRERYQVSDNSEKDV